MNNAINSHPAARPDYTGAVDGETALIDTLSQFVDLPHLIAIQHTLSKLTGIDLRLLDQTGKPLSGNADDPSRDHNTRHVAAILAEGKQIGAIDAALNTQLDRESVTRFVDLWAADVSRQCARGMQLQQRVEELDVVYTLSTLLAAHRDLQQVLDAGARSAAEVMQVKAASIRLLDAETRELVPKAVFNLSQQYLDKGPIIVEKSELYRRTLAGEVTYVQDMATDPRVLYPEDARREGLVSILASPMIYQGRAVGVIRLYTGRQRQFSRLEINMLRTVAQLLGTAIENARLNADHLEHEHMQRQLQLAADVQRRMLPAAPPDLPPFDFAARYVPSLELSGDFYDFIQLDGHMGIAIGDVAGKGVAASLLMASVRAALRAYAQDIYDLDQIIAHVNVALTRDTLDNEFATLFYGVIDPSTMRMTYCNAGHDPPLLLRDGEIQRLTRGGMIVGVDAQQQYEKGLITLQRGDLVLLYTDGLTDAQNFQCQNFGLDRVIAAMHDRADMQAHDVLSHVLWEMRRFVGLNRSVDDTTIVTIKVK